MEINGVSIDKYTVVFDEVNPNWSQSAEYNLLFVQQVLRYAHDRMRSRGHIFVNEVLDDLGFPRSREGAVLGWMNDGRDIIGGYSRSDGNRIQVDLIGLSVIADKI